MSRDKGFSILVAGVCFSLVFIIVYTAVVFAIGSETGYREAEAKALRPIVRQGELPYNVPVMVYTIRDDGTISGESALRTDYAGVLPFSTTGKAVDLYGIGDYDYWTELDAVFAWEP